MMCADGQPEVSKQFACISDRWPHTISWKWPFLLVTYGRVTKILLLLNMIMPDYYYVGIIRKYDSQWVSTARSFTVRTRTSSISCLIEWSEKSCIVTYDIHVLMFQWLFIESISAKMLFNCGFLLKVKHADALTFRIIPRTGRKN